LEKRKTSKEWKNTVADNDFLQKRCQEKGWKNKTPRGSRNKVPLGSFAQKKIELTGHQAIHSPPIEEDYCTTSLTILQACWGVKKILVTPNIF